MGRGSTRWGLTRKWWEILAAYRPRHGERQHETTIPRAARRDRSKRILIDGCAPGGNRPRAAGGTARWPGRCIDKVLIANRGENRPAGDPRLRARWGHRHPSRSISTRDADASAIRAPWPEKEAVLHRPRPAPQKLPSFRRVISRPARLTPGAQAIHPEAINGVRLLERNYTLVSPCQVVEVNPTAWTFIGPTPRRTYRASMGRKQDHRAKRQRALKDCSGRASGASLFRRWMSYRGGTPPETGGRIESYPVSHRSEPLFY